MSPLNLRDRIMQLAETTGPGAAERMEQFALDVAAAFLDGRGVTVSTNLRVDLASGRPPYHLEPGDTFRATELTGAMRFFTVNNNKDEVILAQSRRIAELLAERPERESEPPHADVARLNWLDALSNEACIELGFEMDGGVYLHIDSPGCVQTDVREQNSARAAIDFGMTIRPVA